jgi:hypothetical protein
MLKFGAQRCVKAWESSQIHPRKKKILLKKLSIKPITFQVNGLNEWDERITSLFSNQNIPHGKKMNHK